jgi:hypothetical protein
MGREIRRVPGDWQHPKYSADEIRYDHQRDAYHPMFDTPFSVAMDEWYAGWKKDGQAHIDDHGAPPDPAYYRDRDWTIEEATHYAVYETVSEGTPVTPAFATKAELIDHLVAHGDAWDEKRGNGGWDRAAAERFVDREWAPSMMVMHTQGGTTIQEPRDGI